VQASQPVTLALVRTQEWNGATDKIAALGRIQAWCMAQGVVNTMYTCDLDTHPDPVMLIIQDQRTPQSILGVALESGVKNAARSLVGPNDVTITYVRWGCVTNCDLPDYRWQTLFKEKYQLSPIAKTYGPLTLDHEGTGVHVKIKSPVPMLLAVLPFEQADQLRANPDQAEALLTGIVCKQRGVQSSDLNCTLSLKDGPQQVVIMPEPGVNVPRKKAQVTIDMVRCIDNCKPVDAQ
jgi:hypothetical protein